MTPAERSIVKALIAVAWADGRVVDGEMGVIEGLLWGLDASDDEERELLEYAKTPRTIRGDVPLAELSRSDRELLMTNAALLTRADGIRTPDESEVLAELAEVLDFSPAEFRDLVEKTTSSEPPPKLRD